VTSGLLGLIVACAFPDVTFGPGPSIEAGASDASGTDTNTDTDASTQLPADVDPNGWTMDAATRGDSGGRIDPGSDAAGCAAVGGSACDCDDDKALNGAPNCTPAEGGFADCDDFDPLVFPSQGFVNASWDPTSPHRVANDWNCDNKVDKQYPYNVTCGFGTSCSQGFAKDVACGETATYHFCKQGLLGACSVERTEQRTQGCR
jgi:hypothetical protein